MRIVCAVTLAVSCITAPLHAFAWTALAHSPSDGSTHLIFDAVSPDSATADALAGCAKSSRSTCAIVGQPVRATAAVVYKGKGGIGFAANVDPMTADREARDACTAKYAGCKITNAVWDAGLLWFAVAHSSEKHHLQYGESSKDAAEAKALQGCEAAVSQKGACVLLGGSAFLGQFYLASAGSPKLNRYYFSISATSAREAAAAAMKGCAALPSKPDDCKITEEVGDAGPTPAPASMKDLIAKIKPR